MAVIEGGTSQALQEVDAYMKSARVSVVTRGPAYSVSSVTGTIAAALAANSTVFAMRLDPAAPKPAYLSRIVIDYVTIAAFTVPVTAGRRLAIYRGSGAPASGGTPLAVTAKNNTLDGLSQFNSAEGGDVRIATTAGLTVTGITFETQELDTILLVGQGAAGAVKMYEFSYDRLGAGPIVLQPGELMAIRNPQAMDAGGTWQIGVSVDCIEAA